MCCPRWTAVSFILNMPLFMFLSRSNCFDCILIFKDVNLLIKYHEPNEFLTVYEWEKIDCFMTRKKTIFNYRWLWMCIKINYNSTWTQTFRQLGINYTMFRLFFANEYVNILCGDLSVRLVIFWPLPCYKHVNHWNACNLFGCDFFFNR